MSDLERRLTAALHETFDDAVPPPRLMDLIMRRHRRHRLRRNMAGMAAAAIAVVLPIAIPACTCRRRRASSRQRLSQARFWRPAGIKSREAITARTGRLPASRPDRCGS